MIQQILKIAIKSTETTGEENMKFPVITNPFNGPFGNGHQTNACGIELFFVPRLIESRIMRFTYLSIRGQVLASPIFHGRKLRECWMPSHSDYYAFSIWSRLEMILQIVELIDNKMFFFLILIHWCDGARIIRYLSIVAALFFLLLTFHCLSTVIEIEMIIIISRRWKIMNIMTGALFMHVKYADVLCYSNIVYNGDRTTTKTAISIWFMWCIICLSDKKSFLLLNGQQSGNQSLCFKSLNGCRETCDKSWHFFAFRCSFLPLKIKNIKCSLTVLFLVRYARYLHNFAIIVSILYFYDEWWLLSEVHVAIVFGFKANLCKYLALEYE